MIIYNSVLTKQSNNDEIYMFPNNSKLIGAKSLAKPIYASELYDNGYNFGLRFLLPKYINHYTNH